jgi:hypothetical protein
VSFDSQVVGVHVLTSVSCSKPTHPLSGLARLHKAAASGVAVEVLVDPEPGTPAGIPSACLSRSDDGKAPVFFLKEVDW